MLTILISLVLVAIFVMLYLATRREDGFGGAERHSLLPFHEEDSAEGGEGPDPAREPPPDPPDRTETAP